MDSWLAERIRDVFRLARKDTQYAKMQKKHDKLEAQISECLQSLPDETQDIFWEYICLSDDMNWRMLELLLGGFPMREHQNPEQDESDFPDSAEGLCPSSTVVCCGFEGDSHASVRTGSE